MVDGVGEEVGVDEDLVGGLEGGVVGEEHAAGDLWAGVFVSECRLRELEMVVGVGWTYTSRISSSLFPRFFLLLCSSFFIMFFLRRASRLPITLFTAANLRVRF